MQEKYRMVVSQKEKKIRELQLKLMPYFNNIEHMSLVELENIETLSSKKSNPPVVLPAEINLLTRLRSIIIQNSHLNDLPDEFFELQNIEYISIRNCEFAVLPFKISQLKYLAILDISGTRIKELPEWIGDMMFLEQLDISRTPIIDVPFSIIKRKPIFFNGYSSNLHIKKGDLSINIYDTLTEYDHSVLTNNPKTAYNYLIKFQRKNSTSRDVYLREAKITLLGEGDAGKTSLSHLWVNGMPTKLTTSTRGVEINHKNVIIDNETYRYHIWDFGGQDTYHPFHTLFLTPKSIYIVVLNGRQEEIPDEWLHYIDTFAPGSPVILVINKTDERPRADINAAIYIQNYANIYPNIIKISCTAPDKGVMKIETLYSAVEKIIQKHRDNYRIKFPQEWVEVRTAVEKLYNEGTDYITTEQFSEICFKYGEVNELNQKTILETMNRIGTALSFGKDRSSHVLNPDWVCGGIYKILESDVDLHGVLLSKSEFKRVLRLNDYDKRYSKLGADGHLLGILKDKQLCLEILGTEDLFMPVILPSESPSALPNTDIWTTLAYKFEFLPPTLIHQLMVRHWLEVQAFVPLTAWRYGAVLRFQEHSVTALIESNESIHTIYLRINPAYGTMDSQRIVLASLTDTMDHLINVNKISPHTVTRLVKILVTDTDDFFTGKDEYISYITLLRLDALNVTKYRLPQSLQEISIPDVLLKYCILERRAEMREQLRKTDISNLRDQCISEGFYLRLRDILEIRSTSDNSSLSNDDKEKIKLLLKEIKQDEWQKGLRRIGAFLKNSIEICANIATTTGITLSQIFPL